VLTISSDNTDSKQDSVCPRQYDANL